MAHDTTRPPLQHLAETIRVRMEKAPALGYGLGISVPGERVTVFAGETVAGSGRHIGPASRFPIACLMKLLVSIRCLQLVEAGRLDLDDLAHEHAEELRSGEASLDSLRIRHLLSHTGGYVEPGNEHRWTLSWETFSAFMVQRRQAFWPGEAFSYSQTGHCILARIIERLDGVPIFQSVHDHILGPLGVSAGWRDARSPDDVALHVTGASGLTPLQSRQDRGILKASIGDGRLAVDDLLAIGEALVGRGDTGDAVVSPAIRAALFSEVITIPLQPPGAGVEDVPIAYGLGLGRYRLGFGQNGSYVGTAIGLRLCPDTQTVAVTALNAWLPVIRDNLMLWALAPLARPPRQIERPPAKFTQNELAGRYQGLGFGARDIEIAEDGRILHFGGAPDVGHVLAQAEGGLAMTNKLSWATLAGFHDTQTGEVALHSAMSAFRKYPAGGESRAG